MNLKYILTSDSKENMLELPKLRMGEDERDIAFFLSSLVNSFPFRNVILLEKFPA